MVATSQCVLTIRCCLLVFYRLTDQTAFCSNPLKNVNEFKNYTQPILSLISLRSLTHQLLGNNNLVNWWYNWPVTNSALNLHTYTVFILNSVISTSSAEEWHQGSSNYLYWWHANLLGIKKESRRQLLIGVMHHHDISTFNLYHRSLSLMSNDFITIISNKSHEKQIFIIHIILLFSEVISRPMALSSCCSQQNRHRNTGCPIQKELGLLVVVEY